MPDCLLAKQPKQDVDSIFLRWRMGKQEMLCYRYLLLSSFHCCPMFMNFALKIFKWSAEQSVQTQSFLNWKYWLEDKMLTCDIVLDENNPVVQNEGVFNALISGTNNKQQLSVWLRAIWICQWGHPAVFTLQRSQTMSDYSFIIHEKISRCGWKYFHICKINAPLTFSFQH